jgi:Kef-type K+ transport system membrane component KefB/nucleotide-binding universal stress UspA family protein
MAESRFPRGRRIAAAATTGIGLLILSGVPAFAAAVSGSGKAEGLFIAEIVLLLAAGRGLGELMQRIGQPAVMGQLVAGILLGPSVFGLFLPELQKAVFPGAAEQQAMINAVSQLGILMLLLLTGMDTDLKLVRRIGKAAFAISATGILVPFALGFVLGQFLPDSVLPAKMGRLVPSLFLGTALSISSVKIVATIVREMNFLRRDVGQIIVASAIIEDTIGWVIIAITFGLAAKSTFDVLSLTRTVIGVAAFMALSFTLGRRIVFFLIRWANDTFQSEFPVITMILIIMGVMAGITQLLGVHTVLGAFVAGILIGESPILTEHVEDQLRGLVTSLFMPVFFGLAGLTADLTILKEANLALLTAGLVLIASLGKFSGAFLGGEIGGLHLRQSTAVGAAMNARGSTEVIVASIGLAMGALTQNLYTMIVTMAIVTTLAMPPMLRRALSALPISGAEKVRIEREAIDQRGFVSNLERVLLAVDGSQNGKFLSRVAGLIAGARGMPITIVRVNERLGRELEPADGPVREVKEGAKKSAAALKRKDSETEPEKVHITTRVPTEPDASAINLEARKGFDLLMIGLAATNSPDGTFNEPVTKLAKQFEGPLTLLASNDPEHLPTLTSRLRILVPINGTPAARRAAEFAFAIARPTGARVTALYVSAGSAPARRGVTRVQEEALLKDIAQLGERYDASLRTALQPRGSADSAILKNAAGHNLIVMGVTQRPGDQLFFGNTASAILTGWKGAALFVAS